MLILISMHGLCHILDPLAALPGVPWFAASSREVRGGLARDEEESATERERGSRGRRERNRERGTEREKEKEKEKEKNEESEEEEEWRDKEE